MSNSDRKLLQVLLIGPRLAEDHPSYSGEHAYIENLLRYPPRTVEYVFYADLLKSGSVQALPWSNRIIPRLARWFSVPYWGVYLQVKYRPDLIHAHGFSVKLELSDNVPVVLSGSVGYGVELRNYMGYDENHARQVLSRQRLLAQMFRIYDRTVSPRNAASIILWSEFARVELERDGFVDPQILHVIPPNVGLSVSAPKPFKDRSEITFLFVGNDFERKNGPLVLDAFSSVRNLNPPPRLVVVSSYEIRGKDPQIRTFCTMPRKKLFEEIFPQVDVIVLPSKAEGFGLVLLEAMAFSIPAIAVDAFAIPEIVKHGETGFLLRSKNLLEDLKSSMATFIQNPALAHEMGEAARVRFAQHFSIKSHNSQLFDIYDRALSVQREPSR